MDKLQRVLSGNDSGSPDSPNAGNPSIMNESDEFSTLSWSNRVRGFCLCFVVGLIFSFIGSLVLFLSGSLAKFAIFYTLGNIISIASTCFLVGPMRQLKNMFDKKRIIATIIVVISFVLTLIAAIVLRNSLLAFLFIIIQWLAMTWYSLSYIPYARTTVKNAITSCIA